MGETVSETPTDEPPASPLPSGPIEWLWDQLLPSRPRLRSELASFAHALGSHPKADPDVLARCRRLVDEAEASARSRHLDRAWALFHEAQREALWLLDPQALGARADALREEAGAKLNAWRAAAVEAILTPPTGGDLPPHKARVALELLHEAADNRYFKIGLIRRQIFATVVVLLSLAVVMTLYMGRALAPELGKPFAEAHNAFALCWLWGALSANLNSLRRLLMTGLSGPIPLHVSQLNQVIARPVVGGISAAIVVIVVSSEWVTLPIESAASYWALAAAAGFSEALLDKTLQTVSPNGSARSESDTRGGR